MTIRRYGLIGRVYFWMLKMRSLDDPARIRDIERNGTNLCQLFSTVFIEAPMFCLFAGALLAICGPFLLLLGCGKWLTTLCRRQPQVPSETARIIGAWLSAKKRRICPHVEFESTKAVEP